MPTFYDSKGNSYALNQQIGRGGEGTVFYCPDDLSLVAKIYHEAVSEEKAEKLRWMAENKNDQLLKVAAWIVDTLTDEAGSTVGFLMPNVKAKEIHELYSLKSRRVHFPEANWQFLIHTAANVARAFYVLHKHEHIMGDVNHGNCVVLADGTVKLIDCDSYSIKNGAKRYVCDVGVATHLAPELQGADLSRIEREETHDNFGLAVIIFQLLFLGRHPFAGNYLGAEDKSLEDCIREHRFAYGNEQTTNVKQPPGTLSLVQISPRLAAMFNRAFLTDTRPEPREWIEALEDLSASLRQCSIHIGHFFFNELSACPWCEIESKTGLMLFPFVSGSKGASEFNIFTVENLLASLDIPQNLPAEPFKTSVLPPPSAKARELRAKNKARLIGIGLVQFIIVLVLTLLGGGAIGFTLGVFLMLLFFAVFQSSDKPEREHLKEELEKVRYEWSKLDDEWKSNPKAEQIYEDLALVRTKVSEHQVLQQQSREKMKYLENARYQYQLDRYLSAFPLANISGIDKGKLDLLENLGILTAKDVEAKLLYSLPRIDRDTKNEILEWRRNLERNFVFSPGTDLPEADKNRFALQFTERRARLEKDIEQMLVSLRSGSLSLKTYQNQMVAKSQKLAQKLTQTESDLAFIGNSVWLILTLLSITIFVPMFGSALQNSSSKNQSVTPHYPSTFANTTNIGRGYSSNPNSNVAMNVYASPTDYPVRENMTDEEIWQMTDWERKKSADTLFVQGNRLIGEKNYKSAEKKLRYSLRFVDDNPAVLNSLGQIFYEQAQYKESLEFLEKSLKFNSQNESTKLMIGANYLKLRKFEDAIVILLEVRAGNSSSYEAAYNLGSAHKELKNYNRATEYFSEAVSIKPNDSDAHYELAFCLYKNGDKELAEDEYYELARLDPDKAEKLLKVTGMKVQPRVINRVESVGVGRGIGR